MAVTPIKDWEYVIGIVEAPGPDLTDRNRRLWVALKRALTGTGGLQAVDAANANISLTKPWVVMASSNGVTSGAADHWTSSASIVGAANGVAHSWIHLRMTDLFGAGDHLHLLLSVENLANCALGYLAFSRGATGWNANGTTTTRPTHAAATAALVLLDGTTSTGNPVLSDAMWGNDAANDTYNLHVRIADDGSAGGWFGVVAGKCTAFFQWQDDQEGPARTYPFSVFKLSQDSTTEVNTSTAAWQSLEPILTLDNTGAAISCAATQTVYGANKFSTTTVNTGGDGSRFLETIKFINVASSQTFGLMVDMWWASTNDATGDGAPATPPVTFRQIGEMMIPWPSGAAMTI